MYKEVISMLKSYPAKIVQIKQLRFELEHPSLAVEKDLIDSLSFGQSLRDGGGSGNRISDRTMEIALRYHDIMEQVNGEVIPDILNELRCLETEVARIEYYISLLSDKQANIIRLHFFEGRTFEHIAQEMKLTVRTVISQQNSALKELSTMFSFIESVKGSKK